MIKNLNDYELLYLIKRGNVEAYELLLKKYKSYSYYKMRMIPISDEEKEEVSQECLMVLSKVVSKFNENYEVLFVSYIDKIFTRIINKHAISAYKRYKAMQYSIDEIEVGIKEDRKIYSPYDEIVVDEKIQKFSTTLSENEKMIFDEVMISRLRADKFAEKHDMPVKKVYYYIQKIRKKYEQYIKKYNSID